MQHKDFNSLYSEIMYEERDIIEKFLKDQYDIRYGRQRDMWHFEPAVEVVSYQGSLVQIHDIKLDKDKFVVFYVEAFFEKNEEWECSDFAYGELSKVIEALPDANKIVKRDAINDLGQMTHNLRIDLLLKEHPFVYTEYGCKYVVHDVKIGDNGTAKPFGTCDGEPLIADNIYTDYTLSFVKNLRDHINIEVLHQSDEYKSVMALLYLEPNLYKSVDEYNKTHYGLVTFTIEGTDIEFDVSAIQRDDKGNLTIFGADTCCEDEQIVLTEKEIRKEYLAEILKWMRPKYSNIMDTYNAHDAELVRKINAAWKSEKYHDMFGDILFALGCRDKQEVKDKFDIVIDCNETAMDNAHEIMEGVCDDLDLEMILKFIRYEE